MGNLATRECPKCHAALGCGCFCGALFGLPGLIIGGVGGALAVGNQSSVQASGAPHGWHGRGGKTMKMYHGTTYENGQSIIKNGFNPSSGGMLGQGVYLSADIEKAKRHGSSILVVEAKLGKTKKIDSQSHPMRTSWNSHGYDSAWVPAHCGMVHSGLTETCVFDPDRNRVMSYIM